MIPTALAYFHDVARTGSISEAAAAHHVSASAISKQIQMLERAVGVDLFVRHPRGMRMTEAGSLLYAHTRRTEADGTAVLDELRNPQSRRHRTITVASSEGLASWRVPSAIARFTARHPDVDFQLLVVPTPNATRLVVEGQADVACVYSLGPQHDVVIEHSVPAPTLAVTAGGHPLAGKASISLEQLCEYPLAMTGKGVTQRELFDIATRMEGLAPRIALTADALTSLLEFARGGSGIAVVSRLSMNIARNNDLALVPIDHPIFQDRRAQIQTMAGRQKSAVVIAFLQTLSESFSEDYV